MSKRQVLDLMKGSKTKAEWEQNCKTVRGFYNGNYPGFWHDSIVQSGLYRETKAKW